MKNRQVKNKIKEKRTGLFVLVLLCCMTVASVLPTYAYWMNSQYPAQKDTHMTVVTSFYPMYIAAMNLTEHTKNITLKNLSEPQTGCLHDYQLTPQDMKLLSTADVFIVNGGGIETFLTEVAKTYPHLTIINASQGISLLKSDGETTFNAHVWMSVPRYRREIANMEEGLRQKDPTEAKQIAKNAKAYDAQLKTLQNEEKQLKKQTSGKPVVLFHEAYAYLAEDLDMPVSYVMDLDEERKVSANEMAAVARAISEKSVFCVLADPTYGKKMGNAMQKETGVTVLYLNTLVKSSGSYQKNSYIEHMKKNLKQIKKAVESYA